MSKPNVKDQAVVFRPEEELLLCCARTCMDSERAERIRALLCKDMNWEYLIQTAVRQGIMPLLYRSLNATCPEALPKAVLERLRLCFYANDFNNRFLTKELLRLLNLFETNGIPAFPYKGPVLAATIYGNLSLRQFGDLDILVHKKDFLRVKALLISEGYQPWRQLTSAQEVAHLRSDHAYTFERDGGRICVDLHWRFTQRYYAFPLDPECLCERLESVPLADSKVLSLPPEDLLLILCVHGTKDGWARLLWICDIAELIRVYQGMDWGRVMEQAGRLRSKRMLFLGLLLARKLLGVDLPEEVLQTVQADPVVKSLSVRVCERLFSKVDGPVDVDRMVLHCGVTQRLLDRVPYLLYRLAKVMTPNVRDRSFLPLPASLFFLHYLLRPIRLLKEYGLRPFKPLLK